MHTRTPAWQPDSHTRATARDALRAHTQWILSRPHPAERLFVEGYFARSLVAAHDVLGAAGADSTLARAALRRATAFADSLVTSQRADGYWSIGYGSGWVADMGASLAIFAALEPYVDAERLASYTQSAERFAATLERDGLARADGAIGVGWPTAERRAGDVRAWRSDTGWSDAPYGVATALAGVELHAWLAQRTGDRRYRDQAERQLEWTMVQVRSDGGVPAFAGEGELATAAYLEEGWMAAARMLGDDDLPTRLCTVLATHVDWVVRRQRADGTWGDSPADRARTPAIANFLLWFAGQCEERSGIARALDRAAHYTVELDAARLTRIEDPSSDPEVLVALAGRPLAAFAGGRPVP